MEPILGAIFAARVGTAGTGTIAVGAAGREDVIGGAHTVFLVTAPIALLALLAVIAIKEVPLRGAGEPPQTDGPASKASSGPDPRILRKSAQTVPIRSGGQ